MQEPGRIKSNIPIPSLNQEKYLINPCHGRYHAESQAKAINTAQSKDFLEIEYFANMLINEALFRVARR